MSKHRKFLSVLIDVLVVVITFSLLIFLRHSKHSPIEDVAVWMVELPMAIVIFVVGTFGGCLLYMGIKNCKNENKLADQWRITQGTILLLIAILLIITNS